MITRQPSFKDYSKIAELASNTEFIAEWMYNSKQNKNCVSLVTIEKKKVIAVLLGEYLPKIERLELHYFNFPSDKPDVGKFILNKAVEVLSKCVKDIQVLGVFSDHQTLAKVNMKPKQTMYMLDLNEDDNDREITI